MDQLVADEAAASGGEPVDDTTVAPEAVEIEASPIDEMYPDEARERPEGAPEGDEEEAPEGGEDEPVDDQPAIDPPHSWKAEDKAKWGDLPRDAQEIIARRETEVARLITAKSDEARTTKDTVVKQARSEIAEFRQAKADEIGALAAMILPQQPDQQLLFSQNPEDRDRYWQQKAIADQATAIRDHLSNARSEELRAAQSIRDEEAEELKAADDARLREQWPEWFTDGEEGRKLQGDLKSIALEVGYPEELWEERNASDVLALRRVADWKAKAQKWDSYDRNRRATDGRFKPQRTLPPVTKPGTSGQRGPMSADPVKLLYPND